MYRHYTEIVGLIGAGKSTRCTNYKKAREGQRPNVSVEMEETNVVLETVYPLLGDIYNVKSGVFPRKEYLVEATFAVLRLVYLKGILGLVGESLGEYIDQLLLRLRFGAYMEESELESLRSKLKEEAKDEKYSPRTFQVLERGVCDVLCFILERIGSYADEEFFLCGDMMQLFLDVYMETVSLLFPWTRRLGLPRLEQEFRDLMPARVNYSILMVPVSVRESANRIKQRARAIEVDEAGEVKPRVMQSNMGLAYNVYGVLFEKFNAMRQEEIDEMVTQVNTQENFNNTVDGMLSIRVVPDAGAGFECIKIHEALPKLWRIFEVYWTQFYSRCGLLASFK